ncbi:MAG: fused MFS/spermidine synthase [Oscillospiraceae bacterium]|nr:fused MFS/spermidine synthase [Oscillospiraceae bacterium]
MKEYPILKSKLFLYLTEFFAGVSVMAVELGASRLLAPYFSSSQIVWTIIIGTIMIAMALGNLYGGRAADKNPDPAPLYRRILIAAIWIAAIPVLGKYVILGVSGLLIFTVSTNFLVIAAFVSCMLLFVFPLFLLGTVTPCLVKAATESLDEGGRTVGRLGACNTVGSILGTFLPTFVTIPSVGTSVTFLIFSGILLAIALAFFLSAKKGLRAAVIAVVLYVLCAIFGRSDSFAFWEKDLRYEGESVYNYLQVKEDERRVVLSTNVLFGVQSVMMKEGGLTGMYYDYALAAPVICGAESPRVLVLGNGTGTYAGQCLRYFPGAAVEGVEIDGRITELARRCFALPDEVKFTEYDGRAFLQAVDERYDVILVDAYQDITIPFQMSSVEFFTMVREHLNPGGVMAVNMNMHSDGAGSINEALCDTIAAVFPCAATADVPGTTNRELFACVDGEIAARLETGAEKLEQGELKTMMRSVLNRLEPVEGGENILSDDRAPVELLGMRAIDALIADELEWLRDVYEREGLRGLIDSYL